MRHAASGPNGRIGKMYFEQQPSMSKITKRKQQAITSRNNIYSTALKLMERHGFDNITIEMISKEAGVSVGSFYHYFNSKNDLLFELFKRGDDFFAEKVANSVSGQTAQEMILSYFDHFSEFYILNGIDIIKALYNTQSRLFSDENRLIVTMLREIIAKGIENKELSESMSPREATDFLLVTARGLVYKWCVENGQFPLDKVMHRYIAQMLRSLTP